ncbi:MAG: STAS domain-containing protein [Pseudomonadota bacterium]
MATARAKMLIDRLPAQPSAASLSAIITKLKAGPCKVKIDGSLVARLDPGCLEALLVIARTQCARGDAFRLEAPSDAFLEEIARFGVPADLLKGPTP